MNASRETIYAALFATVSAAAPFATTSRRMRLINEVALSQLPALYQQQGEEDVEQRRGIPPRYTLHVDLAIYAFNPDTNGAATPQLNSLIDAVEAALAPGPGGVQTLGGLVSHCFIAGKIEFFEGALGNKAAAVIPVQLLTT